MISLILACDDAGGIGLEGGLPWPRIPADMAHFQRSTKARAVIMGRKTFESLKSKPLPTRCNIVLSSSYGDEAVKPRCVSSLSITSISLVNTLTKAFNVARDIQPSNYRTYVIGGASIYEQALPYSTRILLTRVKGTYSADTFWTPDLTGWNLISQQDHVEDGKVICVFEEYWRREPAIAVD